MWPFRKSPAPSMRQEPARTSRPRMVITESMLSVDNETSAHEWRSPAILNRRQIFAAPKPPPGVVPPSVMAMDDWNSLPSGVNNWASSGSYGEGLGFLGYPYLAELTQRPEYRRGSEILAKEMTRKWIKLRAQGDDDKTDKIKKIEAAIKRYSLQDVFRRAAEQDGFFGIGQVYIDLGTGNNVPELMTPIATPHGHFVQAKVPKNSLKGFKITEPIWMYPGNWNSADPLADNYYKPRTWYVMGKEVHHTRYLTFVGREVPDILKPAYQFGGLSLTQIAQPYVVDFLRSRKSVSDLLHSFSTPILHTDMETITQPGGLNALINRLQMFVQSRDNKGVFAVNKLTEDVSNVSTPLSTLDALMSQATERQATVWKIPNVILFGITPSGLNASAQDEIRIFYDWAHSSAIQLLDRNLKRAIDVIQLSEFGVVDQDIEYEWVPLWQLDESAQAARQKTVVDTLAVSIESGMVSPEEGRQALAADDNSPLHGVDLSGPAPELPELPEADPTGEESPNEPRTEERDGT